MCNVFKEESTGSTAILANVCVYTKYNKSIVIHKKAIAAERIHRIAKLACVKFGLLRRQHR